MSTSIRELRQTITAAAAALDGLPEQRMATTRALAGHIVALREHMDDMEGRTYAYRSKLAQLYAEAGVGPDKRNRLQSAVRYHTGAMIREAGKAPEHWLDQSPRERSAQRRADRAAVS